MKGLKTVSIMASLCVAFAFPAAVTAYADVADVTAPVISVSNAIIRAYVGDVPVLNVTATDETDGDVDVSITWSQGALDETGALTAGEHTCTLTATDTSDNLATVTLTYAVAADETTYEDYAFVAVIYEDTRTVQVLAVGATVDLSAYGERTGFTRKVVDEYGATVTDFTANFDRILYVSYEPVVEPDPEPEPEPEPDPTPETTGCGGTVGVAGLSALAVCVGAVLVSKANKERK